MGIGGKEVHISSLFFQDTDCVFSTDLLLHQKLLWCIHRPEPTGQVHFVFADVEKAFQAKPCKDLPIEEPDLREWLYPKNTHRTNTVQSSG